MPIARRRQPYITGYQIINPVATAATTTTTIPESIVETCPTCKVERAKEDMYIFNFTRTCKICRSPVRNSGADVLKEKKVEVPNDGVLRFGVELEVHAYSGNSRRSTWQTLDTSSMRLLEKMDDLGIVKWDGSVNNGFEIVSLPHTIEDVGKKWKPVFEHFHGQTATKYTHYPGQLGMHIHVSKKPLAEDTLRKAAVFMNTLQNKKFIEAIGSRKLNGYCGMDRYVNYDNALTRVDKYRTLNLWKANTAEFRFFRSTVKHELFSANLEFTDLFLKFSTLTDKRVPCYTDFIDYLFDTKRAVKEKYPHFWDVQMKKMLAFV